MKTIAEFIPSKFRGVIYSLIGSYMALDLIWNLTPDAYDGRVTATLGALGFALAALNTDLVPAGDGEPHADRGEAIWQALLPVAALVVIFVLGVVLLRMAGV